MRKKGIGRTHQTRKDNTEFVRRWGIHADDLALVEGVTVDAIHMRVFKFGTPFQRRSRMSKYEQKYGCTLPQLADQLGIHPASVIERDKKHNDIAEECLHPTKGRANKGVIRHRAGLDWKATGNYHKTAQSTYFTLEDALDRLSKLKQQHD